MRKSKPPAAPSAGGPSSGGINFRAYFTRNGKRYYAKDYGHPCWPMRRRNKKGPRPK